MHSEARAKARLHAVVARRGGVALALSGEAGVGKTHLVGQLLLGLSSRFADVHADIGVPDLVRALPRASREAPIARAVLERAAAEAVPLSALAEAVVARLARAAPFVLHVEDLHECDEARTDFWRAVARAVTHVVGVGLIVTTRGAPPEEFQVVVVPPLDAPSSDDLLEQAAGTVLPSETKRWVYARARGNPLFTLEFFRFLTSRGHLWSDGRTWRWRDPGDVWPRTVEAIVEDVLSRAERNPDAERALTALALLPHDVPPDLAAYTADLAPDAYRGATLALTHAGILSGGDFVHPLYREVARARLHPERAKSAARRALSVLRDAPNVVASLVELAEVPAEEAARFFEDAARHASERGDALGAAAWLWASSAHGDAPTRARLALRAAHLAKAADLKRSLQYADAADRLDGNDETLALRASLLAAIGRADDAAALLSAHRRDSAHVWRAWLDVEVARGHYKDVVDAWKARTWPPDVATPAALAFVALAHLNLGDVDGAHALATTALDAAQGEGDDDREARARLLHVLSGVAYFRGRYDESERLQNEIVALHLARGALVAAARTLGARAMVRSATHRVAEAVADTELALSWLAKAGDAPGYATQQLRLGALLARAGEWTRAESELLEARDALRRLESTSWLAECEGELAKLYLEWNPPRANVRALRHARAALQAAREVASAAHLADATFVAAWAEARHGDASAALALAEEAATLVDRTPRVHVGMAAWARGLALEALGCVPEALGAYRAGVDALQAANVDVLAKRVRLEVDRLTNDRASAEDIRAFFTRSGMHGRAHVAERYFPPVERSPQTSAPLGAALELLVLGPLEFRRSGRAVTLRGRQGRALLARLLAARLDGAPIVPRLALVDALYPDQEEARGVGALQQLVHRLRGILGAGVVLTAEDGYALSPGVRSDADEFLATRNSRLWRGEAFTDLEDDAARGDLYALLLEAARAHLASDPREAARAALLVVRAAPYDMAALRVALAALRRDRQHKKLASVYAEARRAFADVGETLPAAWQAFLDEDGTLSSAVD